MMIEIRPLHRAGCHQDLSPAVPGSGSYRATEWPAKQVWTTNNTSKTLCNADNNFNFEPCPASDSSTPSHQQLFFRDDEGFMQWRGVLWRVCFDASSYSPINPVPSSLLSIPQTFILSAHLLNYSNSCIRCHPSLSLNKSIQHKAQTSTMTSVAVVPSTSMKPAVVSPSALLTGRDTGKMLTMACPTDTQSLYIGAHRW